MKKFFAIFLLAGIGIVAYWGYQKMNAKHPNPFFNEYDTLFGVPPFNQINAKHYVPAIEEGIKQEKEEIEAIVNSPEAPTFENTIAAYSKAGKFLGRVTSVFYGLSGTNTNDTLQQIAKEIAPKLSTHNDEIRLNPELFKRIKAVYEQRESLNLDPDQLYLLTNLYDGFVKSGANLNEEEKEKLKAVNQEISAKTLQFGQNLLAETNAFKMVLEEKDLDGLPENIRSAGEKAAKSAGLEDGKYLYTTHRPSMYPFLTYSNRRDLREKLFTAYTMRGNNNNENDNKQLASDIAKLRVRRAKILGFNSHADIVLSNRMAKNAQNVEEFLAKIWWPALDVAKKEVGDMQQVAKEEGKKFKIAAWDWWHYAEKVRQKKYNFDEAQIRPYFSLKAVKEGLFYTVNKLFGITMTEIKNIPKPHPDTEAYEVKRADGTHLGVMYMDYHPRASKRGGAWCGSYRSYNYNDGNPVQPVMTINCNFTKPTDNAPALLSIDEVTTLFHEFGHGLDGLFSNIRYQTTFRSRDFTEFPAQIMEHWATEPAVMKVYAKHYETGEVIPDELIQKIQNASLFNQGFITVEYLAAALLDMAYHSQTKEKDLNVEKFENKFFAKKKLIPEIVSRYRTTYFNHIFASGYSAGYYSYIWSGILDNDGFEAFKETSLFNQEMAKRYRENVLEPNGLMDPMEMYVKFRGKEPSIDPLLKSRGLK